MDYYYIENDAQKGPVPAEELVKIIQPSTNVWCQGMAQWAPASTVAELSALMSQMPAAGQPVNNYAPQPAAQPYPMSGNANGYSSVPTNNYNANTYNAVGENLVNPETGATIETHKTKSIVALVISIFMCSPIAIVLGIIALVKSGNVKKDFSMGHMNSAAGESKRADSLANWSIGLSAVALILNILILIMGH